ncbi:hypothetical protein [Streptomyces syringium]|uniref:hypothetical protein n=1 Tax=Streptomyces syringium TaxID=76729 RepID=UPI003451363C
MPLTQTGTIVHTDLEEFHGQVGSWTPDRPFPLLAGPGVTRYQKLLATRGMTDLPAVTPERRPGVVLSAGSRAALAAGHLLAAATGRPHQYLEVWELPDALAAHRDTLVAVVGLAGDLSALGDWPGGLAPRAGVLTARDAPALISLVYRTLTLQALGTTGRFKVTHPAESDAATANAVGFDELTPLTQDAFQRLVVRSHGRECCAHLPDGIICGRSDHRDGLLPLLDEDDRVPSCLRGGGCFRTDLDDEARLSAADINASLVFVQSCSAVALGNNAFPAEVNLGLGFLSGVSVAVVGPVGVHAAQGVSKVDFEAGVAQGLPLGEVVERLNVHAQRTTGELARFGLFGDPALTFATPPAQNPAGRRAPARLADVAVTGLAPADPALLDRLTYWNGTVLPRLARLHWLGVEPDQARMTELRARIRSATSEQLRGATAGETSALAAELTALQADLMRDLVGRVHETWWQFTDGTLSALRQVSAEPLTCPGCRKDRAVLLRLEHRVEPELRVQCVQCRRCGSLQWSTGEITDTGQYGAYEIRARRGTPAPLHRRVLNSTGQESHGAVGFAFVAGTFAGLPEGWSRAEALPPRRPRGFDWTVDLDSPEVVPDEHEAVFLQLVDGVYEATTLTVLLTD